MTLFAQIDPTAPSAIEEAARVVADRLASLSRPRSLCEIVPDDFDYRWLRDWAYHLSALTTAAWLGNWGTPTIVEAGILLRRDEAFGALLLLAAAETARRDAREGHLWPVVISLFEQAETRSALFVQGQPTAWHKAALETAAIRLGLRHVFGIEGTQNYYISVYLQFGFTRRALEQVPYWLAGHPTSEAVQRLLGERHGSRSFQDLWAVLGEYRRNNVTEQRLRQVAAASPWVLPEWIGDLVRLAKEKLELGDGGGNINPRADHQPPTFLDPPRLDWAPPSPPSFTTRLTDLVLFDLSAPRYRLVDGGGHTLATLLRQPDETYAHPDTVELPAWPGQQVASLVEDDGTNVASQDLDLWDSSEELTVYELPSGSRVADAWRERLLPRRAYALLSRGDLELHPPPSTWKIFGTPRVQLSRIEAGWPSDLAVELDGLPFWTPLVVAGIRAGSAVPYWAGAIGVILDGRRKVFLGHTIESSVVGLAPDVELVSVRRNGEPCEFSQRADGTASIEPFVVRAAEAQGLHFAIGLRCGDEAALLRCPFQIEVVGTAQFVDGGWSPVDPRRVLSVHEAQAGMYRWYLPDTYTGSTFADLALFEGFTFLGRPKRAPQGFGRLAGYGADLKVLSRPYNGEVVARVAGAIVDHGVLQEMERLDEHTVRVHFTHPIQMDGEYSALRWESGGIPKKVGMDRLTPLDPPVAWDAQMGANFETSVFAVGYQGRCLGAIWPDNLARAWELPAVTVVAPATTAALVRWAHLPILQEGCMEMFRAFARMYPGPVLSAWLLDRGLPRSLAFDPVDDDWLSTVRRIYWGWKPTLANVSSIVSCLMVDQPNAMDEPLAVVAQWLAFDPLLLAHVVRHWPADCVPSAAHPVLGTAIAALRREIAGLAPSATNEELWARQSEVLDATAQVMQVDPTFLEQGIVRRLLDPQSGSLSEYDIFNLRIALGVAPFRQYLTLRALGA